MKLKHKGVVTNSGREMIMELSSARVPDSSIDSVIQTVGRWLGIHVCNAISERTVGRIIKEGGVAAKLQMVHEIEREKGFTVSGDGTTIRHLNFDAKHITVNAPSYESGNASDSQTTPQLESWKEISSNAYDTYNQAFKADGKYADPLSFAWYMLRNGSDHSEDQQKLDWLLVGWKELW
ncbi:unnamed protein product [Cyclocybe aegerita]|uniref:Uncharacterized protein n=1 Tax=Cyclocybe aegerita TaxID=1973307 RepID=A0A8S0X823_CYCAE|nr:unnamed protein product [Cyclocybe aegerita]